MGLAISLVTRCNECILYHLGGCVKAGANKKEMIEAIKIGVIGGGSITYPNARFAFKMMKELKNNRLIIMIRIHKEFDMEINEQAEKLLKRVNKFILCGIDSDGYPTAKAVLPSKNRGSLSKMFFVTNTHSNYVNNIIKNNKASVYFFNPLLFKGCLLKGEMTVCNDLSIKEKLWKNSYKSAYSNTEKTYSDPDFCVLKFTAIHGRYYSMFKTRDFDI